jgi:hypothetical protein
MRSRPPGVGTPSLCIQQCCGSGMFFPDLRSKTASKEKVGKKLDVITFFDATKFTNLKLFYV